MCICTLSLWFLIFLKTKLNHSTAGISKHRCWNYILIKADVRAEFKLWMPIFHLPLATQLDQVLHMFVTTQTLLTSDIPWDIDIVILTAASEISPCYGDRKHKVLSKRLKLFHHVNIMRKITGQFLLKDTCNFWGQLPRIWNIIEIKCQRMLHTLFNKDVMSHKGPFAKCKGSSST